MKVPFETKQIINNSRKIRYGKFTEVSFGVSLIRHQYTSNDHHSLAPLNGGTFDANPTDSIYFSESYEL